MSSLTQILHEYYAQAVSAVQTAAPPLAPPVAAPLVTREEVDAYFSDFASCVEHSVVKKSLLYKCVRRACGVRFSHEWV
jgi:hypothetical protein